ncbi:alpha/beta hydrolase family protein [Janibacter terrae]|uniref:alpha/beta hydrolase family protein n=1 Tax=Janibacter terrae TaxID=103817 RepID=UPI000838F82D|nr:alpha/beta family hydrolase [Janibacter terrae]
MGEVPTTQGPARLHVTEAKGDPRGTLLLTHGAGGGVDAKDLVAIAATLPERGWQVALVEMPWKVAGKKVAPMPPRLDAAWREIVAGARDSLPGPVVFGGRSAGARVSCRLAPELGAGGVLALSFPLVPPGKGPDRSRIDELVLPVEAGLPVHVVQGGRDPFGCPDDVRTALAAAGIAPGVVGVDEAPGTHSFTGGGAVAESVVRWVESAFP